MLGMLLMMYKTASHIPLPWKTTMHFACPNTLCVFEHNQLLDNSRIGLVQVNYTFWVKNEGVAYME